MNKKLWLILLSALCIAAAAAFCVVGIMRSTGTEDYQDLKSLGRLTFEAYAATKEEDGTYTIYYQSVGDEAGVLSYARYDVGKEEYDSYQFDIAVTDANPEAEQIPKSVIYRYVYTYRKDGELCNAIYDSYKPVEEVAQLISDANHVAPLRFFVFAAILLLCGIYILIVALTRKKQTQNPEQTK